MNNYPEHEKLSKIYDDAFVVQQFIEWLYSSNCPIDICEHIVDESIGYRGYVSAYIHPEQLMALYFDIDLQKLGDEKDQIVADLRSSYEAENDYE